MKNVHSKRTHRWPTWPCSLNDFVLCYFMLFLFLFSLIFLNISISFWLITPRFSSNSQLQIISLHLTWLINSWVTRGKSKFLSTTVRYFRWSLLGEYIVWFSFIWHQLVCSKIIISPTMIFHIFSWSRVHRKIYLSIHLQSSVCMSMPSHFWGCIFVSPYL